MKKKKVKIENLFSDTLKYKVDIQGNITYKLMPFPTLEITEIHVTKKSENSILNKIFVSVSIFDLLRGKYSYKKVVFEGGELIVDLDNLRNVYLIENFQNQRIIFKDFSLKFFSDKKSFNLDQINSEILYENSKIKKINANVFIGEVPFKVNYKNSELDLVSKNIGLKANFQNLFNREKDLKFTFNRQSIFPGINNIFASLKFEINNNDLLIKSEKFQTNLFDGNISIEKNSGTKNIIVINGLFENANFKKIDNRDLKLFLENNLSKLSNLLDAEIFLNFEKIKTKKKLFNKAQFNFVFQKGDIIFEDVTFSSDKTKVEIKGRNIRYQKDNLLFYDIIFETNDLKAICSSICENKSNNDKIKNNEVRIYSKGMLNINKAKVVIQENNFIKQYNDNEIIKLSENLNKKVISGKLENLLDLSKYFNLL